MCVYVCVRVRARACVYVVYDLVMGAMIKFYKMLHSLAGRVYHWAMLLQTNKTIYSTH